MAGEDAPPGALGTGATTGFTWLVSAACLGIALIVSGQILIFKLHGSPATLELLGLAVYGTPFVGLLGFLTGALVLFWAAWNSAPGPWRKLRNATWALALPAAAIATGLLIAIATQTEFPDGSVNTDHAFAGVLACAPLVVAVVGGFALLIDSITRLPTRRTVTRSLWLSALAVILVCAAVLTPLML